MIPSSPILSLPSRTPAACPTHTSPAVGTTPPFPAATRPVRWIALVAFAAAYGCASLPSSQAPQYNAPTSQPVSGGGPGSGTSGTGPGVGTGVGIDYNSVLPWGVAVVLITLNFQQGVLIWRDRELSHRRALARIKAGQED